MTDRPKKARTRMNRSNTLVKINQYLEDTAMIDGEDELDLVTFIVAAQAIKPEADQADLMEVFSAFEGEEALANESLSTQMHTLLGRVSKPNPELLEALQEEEPSSRKKAEEGEKAREADLFSTSSNVKPDLNLNVTPKRKGHHSRQRSVLEDAERAAVSEFARTEQKMDIAQEMLRQGIDPEIVANVTGISQDALTILEQDDQVDTETSLMTPDEISDCLKLCKGGPDMIKQEAELAHKLLVKMKDSLLAMTAERGQKLERTPTNKVSPLLSAAAGHLPKAASSPRLRMTAMDSNATKIYQITFDKKPLGMSWNQTSDGKNLYVQDVLKDGLGQEKGVRVGSVINAFNGQVVYDKGPDEIYDIFKELKLPITISFRAPVAEGANDPKVIMLKEVTGLETETVIKLLHKFNGNVQAANEAFYVAKARTRQWIAKQNKKPHAGGKQKKDKKGKGWWSKWKSSAKE